MTTSTIIAEGTSTSAFHIFLNAVLATCEVDEITGQFKCKGCGCIVYLDWFEKEIEGCMCDDFEDDE